MSFRLREFVTLILLAAFGAAASAQVPVPTPTNDVQKWDFNSGLQGWTVQNSTLTVVWAADATPASVLGTQPYVSPPSSLNYNNGTNIASGSSPNNGSATSPEVDLSSLIKPTLVFQCNFQAEASVVYDKRNVQISKDNFASTVFNQQLLVSGADPIIGDCATAGSWHSHTVTLDPAWGKVRVRVKMDTVDGIANTGAGWFVDDVKVQSGGSVPDGTTYVYSGIASWNFDTGTPLIQGWTVQSSDTFVIWNADPSPAVVANGASYFSPPNSLNYNNATDYKSGTYANNGTATSPEIDLTNESEPRLTFWCNYQTEASEAYDRRTLQISKDNFASASYVFQETLSLYNPNLKLGRCSTPGTWHKHTLKLNPTWGKIRLRVKFDTVDGIDNEFAGWFIDDIIVEALKPAVAGSVEEKDESKTGDRGNKCGGLVVAANDAFASTLGLALAVLSVIARVFSRRVRQVVPGNAERR